MTVIEAPASQPKQKQLPPNSFEYSLDFGFQLNEGQIGATAELLRNIRPRGGIHVDIEPRRTMPKTDSPEEKARLLAEINAHNEERRLKVETFFAEFLPIATAELLSRKVRRLVTRIEILYCPNDKHYTLYVERNPY